MRFLKSLQRKQVEQIVKGSKTNGHVDQKFKNRPFEPPAVLGADKLLIGSPNVAVQTEPHSEIALKKIPEFQVDPANIHPRLITITEPNSHYCEEYRSLRTHVLHESERSNLRSIVVMSVGPSEGKSVTALNLAWMLAQTEGVTALIIDGDLRNPSLAEYVGMETKLGLSDVLTESASLTDALIRLEPSGLHILPGGRARNDVAELISGTRFKTLLKEARESFDFVIVDTPPLSLFTDATLFVNDTDGALFVVRANQVRYGDIERILEGLPIERIIGAVLNDATEKTLGASYYDYKNYSGPIYGQIE